MGSHSFAQQGVETIENQESCTHNGLNRPPATPFLPARTLLPVRLSSLPDGPRRSPAEVCNLGQWAH